MSDHPPQSEPQPAPRRRRRLRRWVTLAAFLALSAWFSHFAYLRITRRPTPRPLHWEAQLRALNHVTPGAMTSKRVRALFSDRPWEGEPPCTEFRRRTLAQGILRGPWDASRRDIAAASTVFSSQAFEEQYTLVAAAIEAGWHDPVTAPPGTVPFRDDPAIDWVPWLLARSRWAREQFDDGESAAGDWLTILRLGRRMRWTGPMDDPEAVGWRVRNVAMEMIYAASESGGAIDTRRLATKAHELLGPALASELFAGDIMMTHAWLERFYVREGGDWLVLSERTRTWKFQPRWISVRGVAAPASRVWNLASPLFYDLATARQSVDGYFAALDGLTTLADCNEAVGLSWSGTELFSSHLTVLAGFLAYPEDWVADHLLALGAWYVARWELEAGLTMLALREYHRRHGAYPDTLDRLVPEFLPRLPVDYGDGETLRYSLTDEGYLLYSVGLDGQDHGGMTWRGQEDPRSGGFDIVFSNVRRPEYSPATSE